MSRTIWAWARRLAAPAILAALVWRLGTGPFLDGLHTLDGRALAAAGVLAVVTTVCSAWRWRTVARGLGAELSLGVAVAACYRSLFLNLVLPGGVVGDVHRGVRHGQDGGDVGRGLRAVAWERTAGQVVQALLTVVVLLALPSPVHDAMPLVAVGFVALAGAGVLLVRVLPEGGRSRPGRVWRTVRADVHDGLLSRHAWPAVVAASALAVAGYVATFLVAARTAGVTTSTGRLLPLALLVLLGAALPGIAGWGPREGVAAWAFSAAGLGGGKGVATAVVYGVMVAVASLPGAVVLVVAWLQRRSRPQEQVERAPWPVSVEPSGAGRG